MMLPGIILTQQDTHMWLCPSLDCRFSSGSHSSDTAKTHSPEWPQQPLRGKKQKTKKALITTHLPLPWRPVWNPEQHGKYAPCVKSHPWRGCLSGNTAACPPHRRSEERTHSHVLGLICFSSTTQQIQLILYRDKCCLQWPLLAADLHLITLVRKSSAVWHGAAGLLRVCTYLVLNI